MKRRKLISRTAICLYLVLAVVLMTSCNDKKTWSDTPNKFIVTKVIQREGQNSEIATYKVEMPDETSLGNTEFWFADSVGLYKVGDVLHFQHYR